MKSSIECEHYTDAFVVKNPGRLLQRNLDLPNRFSLGDTVLDSMPRNRKLLEWLRLMRDSDGREFVQAISEGTKRMTREMVALNLPPLRTCCSSTRRCSSWRARPRSVRPPSGP